MYSLWYCGITQTNRRSGSDAFPPSLITSSIPCITLIGGNRYIAFKVKGDTWWHLLDIKEGKFKNEGASIAGSVVCM